MAKNLVKFSQEYTFEGVHFEPNSLVEFQNKDAKDLIELGVCVFYNDGRPEPDEDYKVQEHQHKKHVKPKKK